MTKIPLNTDAKLTSWLHTVLPVNWLRQTNCLLQYRHQTP